MASHLPAVIFWCIYCCFDPFYSSFSDCNFGQKLFIISLCSIVMSLCYIIIIILSAYNVTNKTEQCPNKSILKIIVVIYFVIWCHVSKVFVDCNLWCHYLPCYIILLIFLVSYPWKCIGYLCVRSITQYTQFYLWITCFIHVIFWVVSLQRSGHSWEVLPSSYAFLHKIDMWWKFHVINSFLSRFMTLLNIVFGAMWYT